MYICISLKRTAHSSMVRARLSEGLWKLSRRLEVGELKANLSRATLRW